MENGEQQAGYNKTSIWQWILIFFAIVIVVYGLIYYFVIAKHVNKGLNYYERSPQQLHSSLPNRDSSITLQEENNSSVSGKAAIKQDNGLFTITISLTGGPAKTSLPAYLQAGSCPDAGVIKLILNPVSNGTSTTTLQMSFDQLKKMEPLAITVVKSKKEKSNLIACGDLKIK